MNRSVGVSGVVAAAVWGAPALAWADPCGNDPWCALKFSFLVSLPPSMIAMLLSMVVVVMGLLGRVDTKILAMSAAVVAPCAIPVTMATLYAVTTWELFGPGTAFVRGTVVSAVIVQCLIAALAVAVVRRKFA